MRTDGRTDGRDELIVAFRNFANAPKKKKKETLYDSENTYVLLYL
jgi:hypothetical protein